MASGFTPPTKYLPPFPSQFPEDILHVILDLLLNTYTDIDAFNYSHGSAPSISLRNPASHPRLIIPIVCRQWNKLSTPHLFHTLIVRFSRAVGITRLLSQRPHLISYIKRLIISTTSNPDITTAVLTIISKCTGIRVLNFMVFSGSDLIHKLDAIRFLPSLNRFAISLPFSPTNSFVKKCVSIVNARGIVSFHICYIKFTTDFSRNYLLPSLFNIESPNLRITAVNSSVGKDGWESQDIDALRELCEDNPFIQRLELTGIRIESDFLHSLQVESLPPQTLQEYEEKGRRIWEVLWLSDKKSEVDLFSRLWRSHRDAPPLRSVRPITWSRGLDETFDYEWMQIEV